MIVVKIRNVVYDEKPPQQAVSQETIIWVMYMKEGTAVLEHLNFVNKVISELPTNDVKIDEED